MRGDRAAGQVRLVRAEIGTDTCVLNRIRRQREVDGGCPAIENLDEVVAELRARIVSPTVNLADDEIDVVVIKDRSGRLWISIWSCDFVYESFFCLYL